MRYCDYHLHTEFSFDSHEKMENVCEAAIEQGIQEIAFTDHYEFAATDTNGYPDLDRRINQIRECQDRYGDRLVIRNGIESGQPQMDPGGEKELFSKYSFDFVIGSVHIAANQGRSSSYDFEHLPQDGYFDVYFEEAKKMAAQCDYDVMGHVTFPFRYVPVELLKKKPIVSYKEQFMELFQIIISRDKGIEVNTSGLRMPLEATMPPLELLQWYRDCGGRIVTVGSDGHSVRSAFSGIEKGFEVLKAAGFREFATYENRKIMMHSLSDGL